MVELVSIRWSGVRTPTLTGHLVWHQDRVPHLVARALLGAIPSSEMICPRCADKITAAKVERHRHQVYELAHRA